MNFEEALKFKYLKYDTPNLIENPESAKNVLPYVLRFPFNFIGVIPIEVRLKEKNGHNLINPVLDKEKYKDFIYNLYQMKNCPEHEILLQKYDQFIMNEPIDGKHFHKGYYENYSGYCVHCGEYFSVEKEKIFKPIKETIYLDRSSRKKVNTTKKVLKQIKVIHTADKDYKQNVKGSAYCRYEYHDLEYEILYNEYQNKQTIEIGENINVNTRR